MDSSREVGFEEQLVLQSRVRINAGLTLHPAGLLLAYTLVLKKKQFERLRLATYDVPTGYVPEDRPLISD